MEKIKKEKQKLGIGALRGRVDNKQIGVTKNVFLNDAMELNVVKSIVAKIGEISVLVLL